jgi:hypothetical protein
MRRFGALLLFANLFNLFIFKIFDLIYYALRKSSPSALALRVALQYQNGNNLLFKVSLVDYYDMEVPFWY